MFDFLFAVDFDKVIRWLTPSFLRGFRFMLLLQAFAAGFKRRKDELLQYRAQKQYELLFTGQRIYLQHYLNDQFDPQSRGIIVQNALFINAGYKYNLIESRPRYSYNKWKAAAAYQVGDFALYNFNIYRCYQSHTNKAPEGPEGWIYWQFHSFMPVRYNRLEADTQARFTVLIPDYMQLTEPLKLKMSQAVDKYNVTTISYEITKK